VRRSSRQFENLAHLRGAGDSHSHPGVCMVMAGSSITERGMISGCRNSSDASKLVLAPTSFCGLAG
jgi:hypothetical protein